MYKRQVLTGHEAVAIDKNKKEVLVRSIASGEETQLSYDKLVLATGSNPAVPPIEGIDLKGVYRFNHPEDARIIRDKIEDVQEAVVIGAGLIGREEMCIRDRGIVFWH